jgi:hypothetical protein
LAWSLSAIVEFAGSKPARGVAPGSELGGNPVSTSMMWRSHSRASSSTFTGKPSNSPNGSIDGIGAPSMSANSGEANR